MGTTTTPVLAQTGPTPLDKYPPMGHRERSNNKQHILHDPNSHTMVRCLQIWDRRVQQQMHGMAMATPPPRMEWCAHAKPTEVPCL